MKGSGLCASWMDLVHDRFIADDATRADRDWDWRWEIPLLTFGGGLVRRPRMFQLCLAATNFPLAMVSLLENERWIEDTSQSSVFVWYLTGAPRQAVVAHGTPKLLTAAALDIAVAVSLNGAAQGRLWLHAAPEGGTALLDWYQRRGLKRVPAEATLPGPLLRRRVNDGRYFYLTTTTGELASTTMSDYR